MAGTETRFAVRRPAIAILAMLGLFVAIHLLGVTMAFQFTAVAGEPAPEPADASFGVVFVVALLVITGGMLLAFRLGLGRFIRGLILLLAVGLAWVVFSVGLGVVLPVAAPFVALGLAIALGVALYAHPRWYVLNLAGVVMGGGAVALFGLSFGIGPILGLLVVLAIYDAISVYWTKHMLSLAEGAIESRLPVMLIIPIADGTVDLTEEDGSSAMIVGLGDAVIPGTLVVSAAVHGPGAMYALGDVVFSLPALGAMLGTVAGLIALLILAGRGRPHAGLPLLNGGAIAGYVLVATLLGIPLLEAVGVR